NARSDARAHQNACAALPCRSVYILDVAPKCQMWSDIGIGEPVLRAGAEEMRFELIDATHDHLDTIERSDDRGPTVHIDVSEVRTEPDRQHSGLRGVRPPTANHDTPWIMSRE